jgi:hypothetical protein
MVTSRRPTLRWSLASGTAGAHVQICRDRGCAREIVAFDAPGASGAPSDDLPAGVLFWSTYGRMGAATGAEPSPTWELAVGARSAPLDTAWGAVPDVNGDGLADVIVWGAATYVYLSGSTGWSAAPSTILSGLPAAGGVGDVNTQGEKADGGGTMRDNARNAATTFER